MQYEMQWLQHSFKAGTKVTYPRGSRPWECNIAAVWGQMATGGGHKETMAFLGVPTMSRTSFIAAERVIGDWWRQQLEELVHERSRVRGEEISN